MRDKTKLIFKKSHVPERDRIREQPGATRNSRGEGNLERGRARFSPLVLWASESSQFARRVKKDTFATHPVTLRASFWNWPSLMAKIEEIWHLGSVKRELTLTEKGSPSKSWSRITEP